MSVFITLLSSCWCQASQLYTRWLFENTVVVHFTWSSCPGWAREPFLLPSLVLWEPSELLLIMPFENVRHLRRLMSILFPFCYSLRTPTNALFLCNFMAWRLYPLNMGRKLCYQCFLTIWFEMGNLRTPFTEDRRLCREMNDVRCLNRTIHMYHIV